MTAEARPGDRLVLYVGRGTPESLEYMSRGARDMMNDCYKSRPMQRVSGETLSHTLQHYCTSTNIPTVVL